MAKVLLVDDDELVRYALSHYLRKTGHEVIELDDGFKVPDLLVNEKPDIIVTDLIMPGVEGIEVIIEARRTHPDLPIIVMSGGGRKVDISILETAQFLGANASLAKPFDENELVRLIEELTG